MKKKILLVIPNMGYGGAQKVSSTIADALSEENDVTFYVVNSYFKNFSPKKAKVYWNKDYSNIHKILASFIEKNRNNMKKLKSKFVKSDPIWTWINSKDNQDLSDYIQKNFFDTVILVENAILYAPLLKKNNYNLNVISWIHNNFETYTEKFFFHRKNLLYEALSISNYVVSLTKEDTKKFENEIKLNNVICIHNPITINTGKKIEEKENIITYTGSIKFSKGYDYLAEIASKLPDSWTIEVAGDGEIDKMKEILKNKNSLNKVIFLGNLEEKELINHYQRGTLYIMTSRYEGFPLVLGEAMNFGLPVIAFDQSGSREVLSNGKYGILVKNGDTNLMLKKINELLNNKKLREEYSIKSLERAKELHISSILKEWYKII